MLNPVNMGKKKKNNFCLDRKAGYYIGELSLQTLHRMPSEQWGCRPALPTVFL